MTTNLGPWTPDNCDEYFLHVRSDGTEVSAEIKRESYLVTIVNVGADFVDEETKIFTARMREEKGAYFFDIIEPRGRGWERDAEADRHTDRWTMWKRRRKWKVEN
jgi:hypothetical protein